MKTQLIQNNFNFNMNQNNSVSLIDCFIYNQKSEYLTGQNKIFCNICKQLSDIIYTTNIFVSPNILILILNRGKDNKCNIKIDFNDFLDITQFVFQKDIPHIIYNLYGVISLLGQSGESVHFVAACKNPVDYKWYRYNDAIVTPIKDILKEVINFGTPSILFYQKKN